MLVRQERVKSLEKLWRDINVEFYQTQANKELTERLKSQKEGAEEPAKEGKNGE